MKKVILALLIVVFAGCTSTYPGLSVHGNLVDFSIKRDYATVVFPCARHRSNNPCFGSADFSYQDFAEQYDSIYVGMPVKISPNPSPDGRQ